MDTKCKCIIIDDDLISINRLKSSLVNYRNILIAGTAINAKDGSVIIESLRPDLVFLDVELPDMTGLDLLRDLKEKIDWPLHVVFYTAYNKFILEALRESAFDFLLKPYKTDELDLIMNRYFDCRKKEQDRNQFHDSLVRILPDKQIFMIATVDGFRILHLNQIGCFRYYSDKKVWMVVLSDLKEIQLKRNTKAKDILEYSASFVQINRDQIINIGYLSMIKGSRCMLFPPFGHLSDMNVSFGYMKQLMMRYSQI